MGGVRFISGLHKGQQVKRQIFTAY